MDRRNFIKSAGLLSAASLLYPEMALARHRQAVARYFDLHPFVATHPEAVFIRRTHVQAKTDNQAKLQEGLAFSREVFTLREDGGIPLSDKIAFKPNVCGPTDPAFVEGVIEGMKELGLSGAQFYLREGNILGDGYNPSGDYVDDYRPGAQRTGVHLTDLDSGRQMGQARLENLEEGSEVIWKEVNQGVIFHRIGYVAPMNATNAWQLNISKFKAHGMGLTLCCKNWQGTCVSPYIHFCEKLSQLTQDKPAAFVADINPEFMDNVNRLHAQHLEAGVPRWDRPGSDYNSGWGMEAWSQKTLDNLSVSPIGLSVIEAIYGRDFLSNLLVFGLNPVKVDIIGHWLGGHEPGNFGLFHAALDRGLTDRINPLWIPVYDWNGGTPVLEPLEKFERRSVPTYYLQRNYDGQSESQYHMVNEPYDYGSATGVLDAGQVQPRAFVLGQNYPNPFNATTFIEYRLPAEGYVRLEICNVRGQVMDVLVDGWRAAGAHVAAWKADRRASGSYLYRLSTAGFQQTRKMLLIR